MTRAYRQPQSSDVPAIFAIQRGCYPSALQEDRRIIHERLAAAGRYCWVAHDELGIFAYLFAYPSVSGKVTPLGGSFAPEPDGDTFYIHDLAVAKRAAGSGAGSRLVDIALANARIQGFEYSALVAVLESGGFWERHGYQVEHLASPAEQANLRSYSVPATYMLRQLQATAS